MRRLARAAVVAIALGTVLLASVPGARAELSPTPLDYVTERIICECGCNNLTVKNCTCGRADRIRDDVSTRLAGGETPEQVLKAYVHEYGEQILAAPTSRGFNLVGWILPFAVVLAGATLLLLVIRRWSRVPYAEAPLVPPIGTTPAPSPDPSFLKRIREELDGSED